MLQNALNFQQILTRICDESRYLYSLINLKSYITAVWAGNEKLICFNVKTDLTFFTKTIPYITLLVIHRVLIMNR